MSESVTVRIKIKGSAPSADNAGCGSEILDLVSGKRTLSRRRDHGRRRR